MGEPFAARVTNPLPDSNAVSELLFEGTTDAETVLTKETGNSKESNSALEGLAIVCSVLANE
jgi:hypothetical protein